MPDWLQILLTITITLSVIAVLVYFGIKIYHNLNKPGTCSFVSFSPTSELTRASDDNYVQSGYISCTTSALWKPSSLTIFNQGPGEFFIGPIQGQSTPQDLPVGAVSKYNISNGVLPNIYYVSGSQYTLPTLTITAN